VESQSLGNDEIALVQYMSALADCLQFPEAHQNIALIYDRLGDFKMCKHHHNFSIEYAASDLFKAFAILNLVNLEIKTPPYPSSVQLLDLIELINEARSLNPIDAVVDYTAGLISEMMGRQHEAMRSFGQALAKNPMHYLSLLNIGNLYFRRNDFASATEFYEQAIGSLPADDHNLLQAHSNLGQSLRVRGLLNAALKSFQHAVEILNNNTFEKLGDNQPRISSPSQLLVLFNLLAVRAILCRWQHLERDEHLVGEYLLQINAQGLNARSVHIEDGFGVSLTQVADPYAVSLFRYGSQDMDLTVSRIMCTTQPARLQSSQKVINAAPRGNDAPLRVGF
jgi:tetratricopeptide (TPR) repeat protein